MSDILPRYPQNIAKMAQYLALSFVLLLFSIVNFIDNSKMPTTRKVRYDIFSPNMVYLRAPITGTGI